MVNPTKEQIKRILEIVPVEDGEYVIPQIIAEWEKIRSEKARSNMEYYSNLLERLRKEISGNAGVPEKLLLGGNMKRHIENLEGDD